MKATTRRLIILDVIIGVVCLLQFNVREYPRLYVACVLSDLVLFAYGMWLLARMWGKGRLTP
jgi:hypothetical protein